MKLSISGDTIDNNSLLGYKFQMNLITTYRILLHLTQLFWRRNAQHISTAYDCLADISVTAIDDKDLIDMYL